jgi:hypothetical protein
MKRLKPDGDDNGAFDSVKDVFAQYHIPRDIVAIIVSSLPICFRVVCKLWASLILATLSLECIGEGRTFIRPITKKIAPTIALTGRHPYLYVEKLLLGCKRYSDIAFPLKEMADTITECQLPQSIVPIYFDCFDSIRDSDGYIAKAISSVTVAQMVQHCSHNVYGLSFAIREVDSFALLARFDSLRCFALVFAMDRQSSSELFGSALESCTEFARRLPHLEHALFAIHEYFFLDHDENHGEDSFIGVNQALYNQGGDFDSRKYVTPFLWDASSRCFLESHVDKNDGCPLELAQQSVYLLDYFLVATETSIDCNVFQEADWEPDASSSE